MGKWDQKVDRQAILDRMRKKQSEQQQGGRDSTEFRPPKVEKEQEVKFKAVILPPLDEGDPCEGGAASQSMEDLWYFPNGQHYINKKRYECPRVHIEKQACPMCDFGFDLMSETTDKDLKSSIAREWLSRENHAVNIYFLNVDSNPQEVRGKVFWWNLPQAIFSKCCTALSAKSAGDDPDEPKAFGVFFDPYAAYMLLIKITHKNDNNNYESSVLVGGKTIQIDKTEEGVVAILAKRHDLFTKFPARDLNVIQKLLDEKLAKNPSTGGESEGGEKDNDTGDLPVSESKEPPKAEKPKEEPRKAEEKPKEESKKAEEKPKAAEKPKETQKPVERQREAEKPKTEEKKENIDPELADLLSKL